MGLSFDGQRLSDEAAPSYPSASRKAVQKRKMLLLHLPVVFLLLLQPRSVLAAQLCPAPNFVALDQLAKAGCVADIPSLGSDAANRTLLGFRSQHGQDEWIYNNVFSRLPKIVDGFFVEFGARDGIEGSNSFFFEKQGWSGLLVEPNEVEYSKLSQNRPGSKALRGALCDNRELQDFWIVSWPGWSGLEKNLRKSGQAGVIDDMVSGGKWTKKIVQVQCHYLPDHLPLREHINLLSADCEGCEEEVLLTLDWNTVLVDVIIRERQCSSFLKEAESIWAMQKRGFTLVNWASSDLIFVRNALARKLGMHRPAAQ